MARLLLSRNGNKKESSHWRVLRNRQHNLPEFQFEQRSIRFPLAPKYDGHGNKKSTRAGSAYRHHRAEFFTGLSQRSRPAFTTPAMKSSGRNRITLQNTASKTAPRYRRPFGQIHRTLSANQKNPAPCARSFVLPPPEQYSCARSRVLLFGTQRAIILRNQCAPAENCRNICG